MYRCMKLPKINARIISIKADNTSLSSINPAATCKHTGSGSCAQHLPPLSVKRHVKARTCKPATCRGRLELDRLRCVRAADGLQGDPEVGGLLL